MDTDTAAAAAAAAAGAVVEETYTSNVGSLESLYETAFPTNVCTVKDVRADWFIRAFARHIKQSGKFDYPKWADYVKTGVSKELGPYDADWIYVRAAAVFRHLYVRPDCGVGAFRKLYGSKQRRGAAPGHHRKGSGKIVRYTLQQFEKLGLVTKMENKGGRRLTKKGFHEADTIAKQCVA